VENVRRELHGDKQESNQKYVFTQTIVSIHNMPVVLEVIAGFSNRLRALVSGICYAEFLNTSLEIRWPIHIGVCPGTIHDCMDVSSLPDFVKVSNGNLPDGLMVFTDADVQSLPTDIRSFSAFYRENSDRFLYHLRRIRLKAVPNTDSTYVGVHIRRGDNTTSITESPIEAFLDHMNKEPASTKFYLATDSSIVKNTLLGLFKERIYTRNIVLDRHSQEGMAGCIQDFVSLSACSKIIGSYWSSFSELTASYGNKELVVARSNLIES
jgi:hypothetical protein